MINSKESRSRPSMTFFLGERRAVRYRSERMFGRMLHPAEFIGLCGAPEGASVEVGVLSSDIYLEYREIERIGLIGSCLIRQTPEAIVLINDSLEILRKEFHGRGIEPSCFHRQLLWAERLGVQRIERQIPRLDGVNLDEFTAIGDNPRLLSSFS